MRDEAKRMKAVFYRRISSNEQAKSGLGLEAQLSACKAHAEKLGFGQWVDFTDRAISGSTGIEEREGLKEALASLAKGDVLIVAKRDRIARDMLVALTVEKIVERRGCKLISCAGEGHSTDVVTDLILKTMSDLFSQVERVTISTRTKNALRVKINKGERVGNVRYGYKLSKDGIHLIPFERERQLILSVRSLRSRGLSLRAIADRLNETKVKSRNGNPWNPSQIQRLLVAEVHGTTKRKTAVQS